MLETFSAKLESIEVRTFTQEWFSEMSPQGYDISSYDQKCDSASLGSFLLFVLRIAGFLLPKDRYFDLELKISMQREKFRLFVIWTRPSRV